MTAKNSMIGVLLIGGRGERFWPRSRSGVPKQFLPITSARPMLAETIERAAQTVDRFIAVTAHDCGDAAKEFFAKDRIGREASAEVIVEPCRRSTAPAIALAAIRAKADDLLAVFPADHFIPDSSAFRSALAKAASLARSHDGIVCFGLRPSRPETGYGYIRLGKAVDGGFRIESFVEKPPVALAARLIEDGAVWNGGIFVVRAGVYLSLLEKHLPGVHSAMMTIKRSDSLNAYETCENISVDHGILEKEPESFAIRAEFEWDDVGDWGAMARVIHPDKDGNSARGEFAALDARNVIAESDGGLIAVIGVSDVAIIRDRDVVLVVKRGEEQRVREMLRLLEERGERDYL